MAALEHIIRELDNRDPSARINAIKKLAQTKDPAALKPLAAIFRSDPDPDVRETARKAGLYIRKFTDENSGGGAAAATSTAAASDGRGGAAVQAPPPPKEVTISPVQEKRAKDALEAAMDYYMRGEGDKALKQLRKAFELNPKLRSDAYSIGLAAQITGQSGQMAVNAVMGGVIPQAELPDVDHRGRPMKKEKKEVVESDWFGAGIWMSILGASLIFGPIIVIAVLLYIMLSLMAGFGLAGDVSVEQVQAGLGEMVVSIIPTFLMLGGLALVGIFGQITFTHFSARFLFGGQGKFSTVTYKLAKFLTVLLLACLIAILAGTIMTPFWPAILTAFTATTALLLMLAVHYPFFLITVVFFLGVAAQSVGVSSDLGGADLFLASIDPIAMLLFIAAFMLQAAWVGKQTADAHRFDIIKGIGAAVVGYVGMIVVSFGLAVILTESIRQFLELMFSATGGGGF